MTGGASISDQHEPPPPTSTASPALLPAPEAFRADFAACMKCGYDRSGIESTALCPECGAMPLPRHAIVVRTGGPGRRRGVEMAVMLALALAMLVLALVYVIVVPIGGVMVLLPLGLMALSGYFGVKAVTRRPARELHPFVFTLRGVARQPLLQRSWHDIRTVTARKSRLTLQYRWLAEMITIDADAAVVAELAIALERMRRVARSHPGASPPTGAVNAAQLCSACGAASPLDIEPVTCPCCGEPPDATVRAIAFGRTSPAALRKGIQLVFAVGTVLLVAATVAITSGVFILAMLSLAFCWYGWSNIVNALRVARLGRRYLDCAWVIRAHRIDVIESRNSSSVGWGEFKSAQRSDAVRNWRLIRLAFADPHRPPLVIWMDEQTGDPSRLVELVDGLNERIGEGSATSDPSATTGTPPSSGTD